MQKTTFAYELVKPSVAIHYKPTASGAGQDAVKADKDAFGMSDSHYLESEYAADPYLQMYPAVAAAVVPCYNLPELLVSDPPLNMSRTTLVDIYLGKIIYWNDTQIKIDNPFVADRLPFYHIEVAARTVRSGTSEIWTTALSAFSTEFNSKIGPTNKPDFHMDPKHFIGTTGSSTVVAAYVALTPHAMGYIVLNEAEALGLRVASFLNKDHIIRPTEESLGYAMLEKGGLLDSHLVADLADAHNPAAWPIAGYSYFILREGNHQHRNCEDTKELGHFFHWFYVSPTVSTIVTQTGMVPIPVVVSHILVKHLDDHLYCNDGSKAMTLDKSYHVAGHGLGGLEWSVGLFGTSFKLTDEAWENVDFSYHAGTLSGESQGSRDKGMIVPADYTVYAHGAAADTPRTPQPNQIQIPFLGHRCCSNFQV